MQPYLASFHETILSYDIGQLYQHYPPLISLCLNQPSPRAALEVLLAYRPIIGSCDELRVRRGRRPANTCMSIRGLPAWGRVRPSPTSSCSTGFCGSIWRIPGSRWASRGTATTPSAAGSVLRHPLPLGAGENTLTIDNGQLDCPSHCYNEPLGHLQLAQLAQICADIAERAPLPIWWGADPPQDPRRGAGERREPAQGGVRGHECQPLDPQSQIAGEQLLHPAQGSEGERSLPLAG